MESRTLRAGRPFLLLVTSTVLSVQINAQAPDSGSNLGARMACVAQPATAFPGDPITVETTVTGIDAGRKGPVYTWSVTGGRISGAGTGARIDTTGVPAGDYIVSGRVSGGHGARRNAECTTAFRIVANAPPKVGCSANPVHIVPGGFATITMNAQSPVNRPLTYSYGASAGQITGTGVTATLATADVNPGTITVRCNVVDDRGQSASATIAVQVMTPPPAPAAPAPAARKLCSVSFERDRKRPVRVDNEGKACLDDIALQLTRDATATLVVIGKHDPDEKPDAAAERTLNVKQYMTEAKGIDPNRIQARTGENTGRIADDVIVPQGATWDPMGTTTFDPTQIQRHGEPYSRSGR